MFAHRGKRVGRCNCACSMLRRRPLLLLILVVTAITNFVVQGQQQQAYSMEILRRDQPRPTGTNERAVLDLTKRVLSRRQRNRLTKRIRRKGAAVADIDLQIIVASNVEHGYAPKEMATELLNAWDMGSHREQHAGGMLILMAMEENRIEIEISDSLAHIFDTDWCHKVLYTGVVSFFQKERYDLGLEYLLNAIEDRLKEIRNLLATKTTPRKGRRRRNLAGLAALVGGHATHPFWRGWFENDYGHDANNNNKGDRGDKPEYRGRWYRYRDDNKRTRWNTGGRRHRGRSGQHFPVSNGNKDTRYGPSWNPPLLHTLGSIFLGGKRGLSKTLSNKVYGLPPHPPPRVLPPCETTPYRDGDVVDTIFTSKTHGGVLRGGPSIRSRANKQRERLEFETTRREENTGGFINTPMVNSQHVDDHHLSSGLGGGASGSDSERPILRREKSTFGINLPPSGIRSSSALGGGASWSINKPPTWGKNNFGRISPTNNFGSSSGSGGGATWSESSSKSKPHNKNKDRIKTNISGAENIENHKSTSNGGGASW